MKKFKFTLASLLRVKQLLEKEKMAQVAEAAARLAALENELKRLESKRVSVHDAHRTAMVKGSSAVQLNNFSSYTEVLRQLIKTQVLKITTAARELEAMRSELAQIMRERKALEKFKEKQYNEYKMQSARDQEKEIDDFVSSRLAAQRLQQSEA